jgi:transposase InsO family protein
MAAWLATQGHVVNRKRVQRLMRLLGLVAIYQRPKCMWFTLRAPWRASGQ